jgi:hypothetical protein
MNNYQIENWLKSQGFKTINGKYYQKPSDDGWYVDVVLLGKNKAQIQAVHETQTKSGGKQREGMWCYDYSTTNHSHLKGKGITSLKKYVRNTEGHSFPLYIIPMAVETIQNRLKTVIIPMVNQTI